MYHLSNKCTTENLNEKFEDSFKLPEIFQKSFHYFISLFAFFVLLENKKN